MKKIVMFCVVVFMVSLFTGCGHNICTYSDGIGLVTTINPETYSFGLDFRYGKILQATVKDNSEVKLLANGQIKNVVGSATSTSQDTAASAPAELLFKTGNQITGYEVELVKALSANPEALRAWLEYRESLRLKSTSEVTN